MSITSQDETSRTRPHRRVERLLANGSISFQSEFSFPPYSVDIYLPEWHLGVEIDGPAHLRKHDEYRDGVLAEKYFLPVLRLPIALPAREIVVRIEQFIIRHAGTVEQRRRQWITMAH